MIRIVTTLAVIIAVAAIAAGGSYAYWSKSVQVNANGSPKNAMSYTTAKISASEYTGFPMAFDNMLPGNEYVSPVATITYTGTAVGDLYFGATNGDAANQIGSILKVKIEQVDGNGDNMGWILGGWTDAQTLFTTWTPLASDLNPDQIVRFKVHVLVDASASDAFQGNVANNGVIIYAVQANGATPTTEPVNTILN